MQRLSQNLAIAKLGKDSFNPKESYGGPILIVIFYHEQNERIDFHFN